MTPTQEQALQTLINNNPPDTPIHLESASWSRSGPSYGTLANLGYMTKGYAPSPSHDPDNRSIVWETTERAEGLLFISSNHQTPWTHPHTETWEK